LLDCSGEPLSFAGKTLLMKIENLQLQSPYRQHNDIFYDDVSPTPLHQAHLISFNTVLADEIGLSADQDEGTLVSWINGAYLPKDSRPFAMCYAGHQFGHFVPRLGDGRAINLGKFKTHNLQLKGAGQTLYSRQGDGRAVLRSSIREYLMSEAMYGLGIATSRALGIVGSDHKVARERIETGSIVMRVSSSWVRFGSFEYFFHNNMHDKLEALADFVISESYPELEGEEDAYYKMFVSLVDKTALMIAQWQSVGFNHGVMNTDNMSIAGLTIDYGPFAFLDDFDPDYICNHTDHEGRYSFSNQPRIAHWNLYALAKALSPLVHFERLEKALEQFGPSYGSYYLDIMAKKLGWSVCNEADTKRLEWMFGMMRDQSIDFTQFFRLLSHYDGDRSDLMALCESEDAISSWLDDYDERLLEEKTSVQKRQKQMLATNPKYVLKNYILQEAIDKAETGDFNLVNHLLKIAHAPFDEHPEFERYAKASPVRSRNLKLSCSS